MNLRTAGALFACLASACTTSDDSPLGFLPSSTVGATGSSSAGAGGAAPDASTGVGGGSGGSGPSEGGSATDAMLCGTTVCPAGGICRDGGCSCPSYRPDTCNATCVDTKYSPDFCGSCTIRCAAGAACNEGSCGPTPTTVVPSTPGCDTIHLALSAGTLYWTDKGHGTVSKLSTTADAGTAPSPVASNQKAPRSLLIAGGSAFWINSGDNTVMKASLGDGGAPTTLVSAPSDAGADAIGAIAVAGSTMYYAVVDGIYQVPTAGGASTLVGIAQQSGVVSAIAATATELYYPTKVHNDVEIMSLVPVPDGGSQTSRVADSQGGLYYDTIIIAAGRVYWGNNDGLHYGIVGAGRSDSTVAHTAFIGNVTGFAVGDTHAYLGEAGDGDMGLGYLERAPLDVDANASGTATVIARDQNSPSSIVVDAANVYWSTRGGAADAGGASGCSIMSMPK